MANEIPAPADVREALKYLITTTAIAELNESPKLKELDYVDRMSEQEAKTAFEALAKVQRRISLKG